ncbi:MAG: hypothetical protein Q9208_003475 [Pyrenodesmia sp. 3 TL-2023]
MHRLFQTNPVLLVVIECLDFESLLRLRLVGRSINSLIATYESSIVTNIARALRNTECEDGHAPTDLYPSTLKDLILFLRLRLPRKLAILAVASDQPDPSTPGPPSKGIPLHDSRGDEIRQKVQKGLVVMSHLSVTYEEYTTSLSRRRRTKLGNFSLHLRAMQRRLARRNFENGLLSRWLQYIESISVEDIYDFLIAYQYVEGKLSMTYHDHMFTCRIIDQLLRTGLSVIDELWSSNMATRQRAPTKLQKIIAGQSPKASALEYETTTRLLRLCDKDMPSAPPQGNYDYRVRSGLLQRIHLPFPYRSIKCHGYSMFATMR